jgi:hypothetical protein
MADADAKILEGLRNLAERMEEIGWPNSAGMLRDVLGLVGRKQAEIERLNEEVLSFAQAAYDAAEPVPVSKERIDEMVKFVLERDAAAKEAAHV